MKLIAGLGNPGSQYELTRHNIGFMAIDKIADAFFVFNNNDGRFKIHGSLPLVQGGRR